MAQEKENFDYAFLMNEFRLFFDGSDAWGCTMHAWFGVAGEMWHRALTIPVDWHYSPAGDPRLEIDDYFREMFDGAEDSALIKFGNVLTRYARSLDRAGESY